MTSARCTTSAMSRFIKRIAKLAQPEGQCWVWPGATQGGYGAVSGAANEAVRHQTTHRLSYIHHKGPIPEGLEVCHSCDNTLCWNPAHLDAKTHAANTQEAWDRGLVSVGDRSGPRGPYMRSFVPCR